MSAPKPSDLYVGIVELFAVLLPGAFLAAAVTLVTPPQFTAFLRPLLVSREAQWVAFAFGAYALGALLFLPASRLDDLVYNPYRKRHWPVEQDHAFALATKLRQGCFPGAVERDDPMNTFAWAKSVLILHAPSALGDVEKYEAESKFFRSLIVALPLAGLLGLVKAQWAFLPVSVVLAGLCFLRYSERRHKCTEWAYRYLIAYQMGPVAGGAAASGRPNS